MVWRYELQTLHRYAVAFCSQCVTSVSYEKTTILLAAILTIMIRKGVQFAVLYLDKIREAASLHQIKYKGIKVLQDIRNLGYTSEEISTCIVSLTLADFQKTIEYPDQTAHDAYIKQIIKDEKTDRIYMKLRLRENGDIQIVEVGSFHL